MSDFPGHDSEPIARIVALVRQTQLPSPTLTPAEALLALDPNDVEYVLHARFAADADREVIAVGLPASPGAASGVLVLSADDAIVAAAAGQSVILVRRETTPDDVVGMQCANGIVTARGGMASHAALVARGWGIPAVVGAADVEVLDRAIRVGARTIPAGSWLSIDGGTGTVFVGAADVANHEPPAELHALLGWADELARHCVVVRASADTAADASYARSVGAQGIGLCRTEHMFLHTERLALLRRFILADDRAEEDAALAGLEDAQRNDFEAIFAAMDGLPVTVRLLDAPLHEFLPTPDALLTAEVRGELDDAGRRVLAAVRRLHEVNPMIGTRGIRLGVLRPALYPMQVRAICRAAAARITQGGSPRVDILIPMVMDPTEMVIARSWVADAMAATATAVALGDVVRVGAMIETPRAALLAADIAAVADFISFGTNDLTQLAFGLSRDDAEAQMLPQYLAHRLLSANPFVTLDERGVGRLVAMACDAARSARSNLAIGVCGEHAGDPASISFLVACGVDSVSCSPSRVMIARLAVAQALLRNVGTSTAAPIAISLETNNNYSHESATAQLDGAAQRVLVLHALRIKGFSPLEGIAELVGLDHDVTARQLDTLLDEGLARFVPARSLWQLTPIGRDHHRNLLPGLDGDALTKLRSPYREFLHLNARFKQLCTEWQMRDEAPNDHLDADYDADCLRRLAALHEDARPIVDAFAAAVARLGLYAQRLSLACERAVAGEVKLFTGVMCGSYHDVWMELHEDLILLLGIDRSQEESF
ncbi:MAG: pyruvate, phosphate dikinase [Actinobacteria bacterium]|nr:MAG: pyruvate, phosphate dikinase [Actinomycetota bacterium]